MYFTGRTQGEIDTYLEELKEERRAEQEAERVRWAELEDSGDGQNEGADSGENPEAAEVTEDGG